MATNKMERERRKVEQELRRIAFANAADYVEVLASPEEGRLVRTIPTERLRDKERSALAAIKESKGGVEVKLKDSLKALELLCKLNGLFAGEKKAEGGQGSFEELLEGLRELEPSPEPGEEEENDL